MSDNLEEFLTKDELRTITTAVDAVSDIASTLISHHDPQLIRRVEGLVTIAPQDFTEGPVEVEDLAPQILKPIGAGAMGDVFLARDPGLQRRVALKQLKKRETLPPHVASRFVSEAQITAQLDHPNIVPVYGLTNLEGQTIAYTMKLVKGRELASVIAIARGCVKNGEELPETLSIQSRLEQFLKVCDAVHFAHVKGVLHRDLKPANIMLGEFNEVYVMDWGLARLIGPGAELPGRILDGTPSTDNDFITATPDRSVAGSVCGTLLYMSPEQARGENLALNAKSDQYTLGLILAELVYLQPARRGGTAIELLTKAALTDSLTLEHVSGEKVPAELEAIVRKAAAFDPSGRYPNVADLAADVRRYLRGEAIIALEDWLLTRALRWIGQHRLETLFICVGLLFAVAVGVAWDLYHHNQMLARTEQRQLHSSSLVAAVAVRAGEIESHFLTVEKRLETIMAVAETLLANAQPSSVPPLTTAEAAAPERPLDLSESKLYGMPITIERPVSHIAKKADVEGALRQFALLVPINGYLQRSLVRSAKWRSTEPDSTDPFNLIATTGTPVRWATIGFETGGVLIYPGNGAPKDDYDPRQRPWYQLAAHTIGKQWGNPHRDYFGTGLLLPCASALYAPDGTFLGVAAVELAFQDIIDEFMKLPDVAGFDESFLLDEEGRILIRSTLPHKFSDETLPGDEVRTLKLQPFPFTEVFGAMKKAPIGYYPLSMGGRNLWIAYAHIPIVGMYYVSIVDVNDLEDDRDPAS